MNAESERPRPLPYPAFGRVMAGIAFLLAIPLVAMQFTDEVRWGAGDFLAAALLMSTTAMAYALATRILRSARHRVAVAVALLTVFATVWAELAVGLFH